MANLKVKVPIEIEDYKERILLGLSLRQLIWGSIAVVLCVSVYFLLKDINTDLATYAAMFSAAPCVCIGFIKSKEGYTFEYFLKIRLKALFGKSKRSYTTELSENPIPQEIVELKALYDNINSAQLEHKTGDEKKIVKAKKKKPRTEREDTLVKSPKKGFKGQRKKALACLKASRGGSGKAECHTKKEAYQRSCPENITANHRL